MISRLLLLLLFCSLWSSQLFAVDGRVKVFIVSQGDIYTSQKLTVSVELLSNAYSITDARIQFPSSSKYIVQAPKSAAYLGKEEIDGEDWTMVHYDYSVYALEAGTMVIPSFSVVFTASMGYGQPKKEFELQSERLTFTVKAPDGVKENQFVLVTDAYSLQTVIKPQRKKLIVGDAVEVSITQKANGVPDILFRPVQYVSNALLRVYEKEPRLQSALKGKYDVSREDSFTFVANTEGNVTLAAQQYLWWDTQSKKLKVETIPELMFEILPDPQIAIDAQNALKKQRVMYSMIALMVLILAYLLFAKKIKLYLLERKRRYCLSEAGHFEKLLKSCTAGDKRKIYHDLYAWLKSLSPDLARVGFRGIIEVQPSFEQLLLEFESGLSSDTYVLERDAFVVELKKLRKTLLSTHIAKVGELPRSINPK